MSTQLFPALSDIAARIIACRDELKALNRLYRAAKAGSDADLARLRRQALEGQRPTPGSTCGGTDPASEHAEKVT